MELADVLAFATGSNATELTFQLDDIAGYFLLKLRDELARAGVGMDDRASRGCVTGIWPRRITQRRG